MCRRKKTFPTTRSDKQRIRTHFAAGFSPEEIAEECRYYVADVRKICTAESDALADPIAHAERLYRRIRRLELADIEDEDVRQALLIFLEPEPPHPEDEQYVPDEPPRPEGRKGPQWGVLYRCLESTSNTQNKRTEAIRKCVELLAQMDGSLKDTGDQRPPAVIQIIHGKEEPGDDPSTSGERGSDDTED